MCPWRRIPLDVDFGPLTLLIAIERLLPRATLGLRHGRHCLLVAVHALIGDDAPTALA